MVDPLSVLGAAVGVTSLIIQLTDECVKGHGILRYRTQVNNLQGFYLYHEAANLPQTHRYILVRLHIEQQRFLHFALEAGILNADGVICSTLQVNRSLLLAILAEIKVLFERYAKANGRYEKVVDRSNVDWDDHSELDNDLMSLLCTTMGDNIQAIRGSPAAKRSEAINRVRGIGKSVAQTAKNLRSIVVELKRLVWAVVDKESFEQLISKLDSLNLFLIALLDSSQFRRLQDSMTTAYLEILQLRNDLGDLTALIGALAPPVKNQQSLPTGTVAFENNALSQVVAEEAATQENKKIYLRRLAEIKIHFTKISELNDNALQSSDFSKFISDSLPLSDFDLIEASIESENLQQRTRTTYQGRRFWIEWKDTLTNTAIRPDYEQIRWRIGLLTDLLRSAKPGNFRAAPCLGYIEIADMDDTSQIGIVFEEPSIFGATLEIITLRELLERQTLERQTQPSLSARTALCATLARCVHSLHGVNWLHKVIRAENIIFFSASGLPNLSEPFVSGFKLSRPSIMDQFTEKPRFEAFKDIYRHPYAQSSQADGNYRKSYDIYSLGVVMIEIALWKHIEDVVGLENLPRVKPSTLREVQPWLLEKPST
jgi:hypothetical protein